MFSITKFLCQNILGSSGKNSIQIDKFSASGPKVKGKKENNMSHIFSCYLNNLFCILYNISTKPQKANNVTFHESPVHNDRNSFSKNGFPQKSITRFIET